MRLSVQLYTVRDPLQKDVPGTLQALRQMRLEYVELAGTAGLTTAQFASELQKAGLQASGMHVGMDRLEGDLQPLIEDAKMLGLKHVILPWIGEERYAEGWGKFGKELTPIAQRLAEAGLTFSYHNHAFELANGDGLEDLFASADPSVKAELDLGWIAVAGRDPVAYIERYQGRLPCVHLKEFSGNPEKWDEEAGKGVLDWDRILPACDAAGVEYGVIEMDVTPDEPLLSVSRCVEFFHSKGLR